jgi:hypothetical protein
MFAPNRSARFAISFMNEMRVASIAFAAYFVSSAERTSITSTRSWLRWNGEYTARIAAIARGSLPPITMRSGRMKSSTAAPSFRNSGFDTTANGISTPRFFNASAMTSRTRSAVPTGTVDLSTTIVQPFIRSPIARAAFSTYCMSAPPSSSGGVPTAMNCIVPCATAVSTSVVKRNRPAATLRSIIGCRPGSWIGTPPATNMSILRESTSKHSTSWPTSARQVPVTRPTYPVPIIVIFTRRLRSTG